MTPQDIALRFERLRGELSTIKVPALYASKIEPLKRMLNDSLVLMRELSWHVETLSSAAKPKIPESKS